MKITGSITANPNPICLGNLQGLGVTTLSWAAEGVETIEVRVGAPDGPLFNRGDPLATAQTGPWVTDGMVFYLQDVSQGFPLTSAHTLATVTVEVQPTIRRQVPGALILMYHRVAEEQRDLWALCVTPEHFAEQLEIIRESNRVLSLRDLVTGLREGSFNDRAVAITFDDGYADNFFHGKPLLERYDIPATVFLTSGAIGCEREFWWDELERLLLQSGRLPETLRLTIAGSEYQWELGEAADYSDQFYKQHRLWRAWEEPPTFRHSLYFSLWQILQRLREEDRQSALRELRVWANVSLACRDTHRPLSFEELSELANGELIEIGCHTVTHSALSTLPVAAQREEIQRSKKCLEDIAGRTITSFAYPYGSKRDYTIDTVRLVKEAGFGCACSTTPTVVTKDSSRFELPRLQVQDWDGDEFARQLSLWFGA